MSVRQMALAWELDLPKPEKFLLLALADHADHDGQGARPSVARLAWKTGDSRRTVQRLLRSLEARGLIEVERMGGGLRPGIGDGRAGRATTYRLHLHKGAKLAPLHLDEAPL